MHKDNMENERINWRPPSVPGYLSETLANRRFSYVVSQLGQISEALDDMTDDHSEYQGRWVNVGLHECGSYLGFDTHDTKEEALIVADLVRGRMDKYLFIEYRCGTVVPVRTLLTIIQMPALEPKP